MNFEDRLIADANWVLRKSWSIRFIIIAALLSGLEVVVPLFSDAIPRGSFATLSFLVTAAAFIARFVAQSHDGSNGSTEDLT